MGIKPHLNQVSLDIERGSYMIAKVDIFSGFLGAGKTMLIKKLLNEKAYEKNIV